MKITDTLPLALAAFNKHLQVHGNLDHYSGIVSLHGMARLATETRNASLVEKTRRELMPYVKGKRTFHANFPNYLCGGNATAWMFLKGHLPEAEEVVRKYAEQIINEAPRDPNGVLCDPRRPGENAIWIDVAFAVTPFLLFAGLAFDNETYLEEAFQQTDRMFNLFRDPQNGLLHQSHNMRGPGHRSEDHWSRGNGWGALAMAELAAYLPDSHPRKNEAITAHLEHLKACAAYQGTCGLWHQEITDDDKQSYLETSGSALLLYAHGLGMQAGIPGELPRENFLRGLKGLLPYISDQTDIFHTCPGCLCPGQGTIIEYRAKPPVMNDRHAFGPVVLAMGQAHLLGIESL